MTRVPRASLVAVVVAVAIGGGLAIGHDAVLARTLENLELATYDARFRVRGAEPAKSEIVLVALDDKTLKEAPALLQRRAGVAALIDAVHAAGAKVIGVDVIFSEPESPLAPALSEDVRAFVDGQSEETKAGWKLKDQADLWKSSRDKQPYVVIYGPPSGPPGP